MGVSGDIARLFFKHGLWNLAQEWNQTQIRLQAVNNMHAQIRDTSVTALLGTPVMGTAPWDIPALDVIFLKGAT